MLGHSEFHVTPRRGELIVFDKLASGLLNHVLLPVPTEKTKGVLVSPTIYGNVLLGPTADDVPDKTDRSTTSAGLASLMEAGSRILPALEEHEVTATYVGLRAATEHRDYQLVSRPDQRYVCAGGIRSTGITGSLAIAEWVRKALADAGLDLADRPEVTAASGCRTSASSGPAPSRRASGSRAIPTAGGSSASASGSRVPRSTPRWEARSRPSTRTGCAGGPVR